MVKKIITLLLVTCCLNTYSQYTPKKHRKSQTKINTKILTLGGGLLFIGAGTISMKTKGLTPFQNNGTKWKMSPSEWAIVGGFAVGTFGIIYKF